MSTIHQRSLRRLLARDLGDDFTLFTVYGGPLAPQNPADPTNNTPAEAKAFWAEHALATGTPAATVSP